MKTLLTLLASLVAVGCATSFDPRLNGSWKSNREATVAEAFQSDSRWNDAPPEKVARFKDIFGHMVLTYTNRQVTMRYKVDPGTFRYTVVDIGEDFVVIKTRGGFADDQDCRIEFEDELSSYWIDADSGLREKFDRIGTEPIGAP
jgi:hypothetical protein